MLDHIERILHPERVPKPMEDVPNLADFAPTYLESVERKNKMSTYDAKAKPLPKTGSD